MNKDGRTLLTAAISGRKSLLKPPFSERLRSGSVILQPGESVGAHVTEEREEAIVIISGTAIIECEGEQFTVPERHLVYIPRDSEHNVINNSKESLEYVYITASLGDGTEHSHGGETHTH